ncbi:MAG: galactokinase [Candidatus Melainabacteria bacterium RIFCSPLOWO2_02_FULL_35_15]|nr:MAG: galactokinase [Candidatus Melainabacteria bacterium RIFCSPLOWO2_12_FULL_35_11]OGI13660.1 MAG: galactokinase [Candidatus Melainabacteria bacterium RIFCSPLOWO2_02_FULL_35_15]
MIITRTPFRITLGGGGTDLPSYYSEHSGFIFSVTIDKYMYIHLNTPIVDDLIRVKYSKYEEVSNIEDIKHDLVRESLRLMKVTSAVEIQSMADIPASTGLGSSGCYLVGLLNALHCYKNISISQQDLAEEACHIEMDVLKQPVGKQDQYTAAFGGFIVMDINKNGLVKVKRPERLSEDAIDELESSLLIYYTNTTRSASEILKEQNKATQNKKNETHKIVVESLHEIKDIGFKTLDAVNSGNLDEFGKLMDVHWQAKKRLSNRITNSSIDDLYELGIKNGALGGKILGAGGGGFMLFYCPKEMQSKLTRAMSEYGMRRMRFKFDFDGSKVMMNIFNRRQSLQRELKLTSSYHY